MTFERLGIKKSEWLRAHPLRERGSLNSTRVEQNVDGPHHPTAGLCALSFFRDNAVLPGFPALHPRALALAALCGRDVDRGIGLAESKADAATGTAARDRDDSNFAF